MKESVVAIVGLTNCCTELARHLVLSGVNIKLISIKPKGAEVTAGPDDYQDDYLIDPTDAGKNVSCIGDV